MEKKIDQTSQEFLDTQRRIHIYLSMKSMGDDVTSEELYEIFKCTTLEEKHAIDDLFKSAKMHGDLKSPKP